MNTDQSQNMLARFHLNKTAYVQQLLSNQEQDWYWYYGTLKHVLQSEIPSISNTEKIVSRKRTEGHPCN